MKKLLFLVLAVALMAGTSKAETCTARGAGVFACNASTCTGPFTGCTMDDSDEFILDSSDDYVEIGVVDMSAGGGTGRIEIQAGAFYQPCGSFLDADLEIHQKGGVWVQQSCIVGAGRINANPDWDGTPAANSDVISLDFDIGEVVDTDYVFVKCEDPDFGATASPDQFIGPGYPKAGQQRWSGECGKWFNIVSGGVNTAAQDVTIEYDEYEGEIGGTYTDTPYQGTRGNISETLLTPASKTLQRYNMTTQITFTGDAGIAVDMDGLGQYAIFDDSDPTTPCAGLAAKIVSSEDTTNDSIWVMGDATMCAEDVRIVRGLRKGDWVEIVRPATTSGSPILISGGSHAFFMPRWVEITAYDKTLPDPNWQEGCVLCFFQHDANILPSGTILYPDIGYMSQGGSQAMNTILAVGVVSSTPLFAGKLFDAGGLNIIGPYIHDTVDDEAIGAVHGVFPRGAANFVVKGARIERITDDGLGAYMNSAGTSQVASTSYIGATIYELIPLADNSQELISLWTAGGQNRDMDNNLIMEAGKGFVQDVIGLGINGPLADYWGIGNTLDRSVLGGVYEVGTVAEFFNSNLFTMAPPETTLGIGAANSGCSAQHVPYDLCTGSNAGLATLPPDLSNKYPNVVSNSFLLMHNFDDAPTGVLLTGTLKDSFIFGTERASQTGIQLSGLATVTGSFIDLPGINTAALRAYTDSDTADGDDWGRILSFRARDSVFSFTASDTLTTGYTGDTIDMTSASLDRCYVMVDNPTTSGPFHPDFNEASVTSVSMNGVLVSTGVATAADALGVGATASLNGETIKNVLFETSLARASAFGSAVPASTHAVPSLAPNSPGGEGVLRSFLRGDATVGREYAPLYLGIQELGSAHMKLGDLFLKQIDHYSDKDLVQ